ncbi:MAG: hypothetical protein QW372_02135 [Nitrososphaerales archaeon]
MNEEKSQLIERQKLALNLLKDYLLTLISTQVIGILLILIWLKTNPSKAEIFVVLFISALILAIFWPVALAFIISHIKREKLRFKS